MPLSLSMTWSYDGIDPRAQHVDMPNPLRGPRQFVKCVSLYHDIARRLRPLSQRSFICSLMRSTTPFLPRPLPPPFGLGSLPTPPAGLPSPHLTATFEAVVSTATDHLMGPVNSTLCCIQLAYTHFFFCRRCPWPAWPARMEASGQLPRIA